MYWVSRGYDQCAVGVQREGVDGVLVAEEPHQRLLFVDVPDERRLVVAGRDEVQTVRVEPDPVHAVGVAGQLEAVLFALARVEGPEAHGAVCAAGGDVGDVGVIGQHVGVVIYVKDLVLVTDQRSDHLGTAEVLPHLALASPAHRREVPVVAREHAARHRARVCELRRPQLEALHLGSLSLDGLFFLYGVHSALLRLQSVHPQRCSLQRELRDLSSVLVLLRVLFDRRLVRLRFRRGEVLLHEASIKLMQSSLANRMPRIKPIRIYWLAL